MSEKNDYKQLRAELDDIVGKLQTEDIDIDEAVELYERGMQITKQLEQYLKEAENKITKIKASFDKNT